MTVTKRAFLEATKNADIDAVIYIDTGVDSIECRSVEVVDAPSVRDDISTDEHSSIIPDGSIVMRLHR